MCNKLCFTKKEAITTLNKIKEEKKKYRHEKNYYYCHKCGAFHLTSIEEFEEQQKIPLRKLRYKKKWKELMRG